MINHVRSRITAGARLLLREKLGSVFAEPHSCASHQPATFCWCVEQLLFSVTACFLYYTGRFYICQVKCRGIMCLINGTGFFSHRRRSAFACVGPSVEIAVPCKQRALKQVFCGKHVMTISQSRVPDELTGISDFAFFQEYTFSRGTKPARSSALSLRSSPVSTS